MDFCGLVLQLQFKLPNFLSDIALVVPDMADRFLQQSQLILIHCSLHFSEYGYFFADLVFLGVHDISENRVCYVVHHLGQTLNIDRKQYVADISIGT